MTVDTIFVGGKEKGCRGRVLAININCENKEKEIVEFVHELESYFE